MSETNVERETQVIQALEALGSAVEMLKTLLQKLDTRLKPVMRQATERKCAEDTRVDLVPLASRIDNIRETVNFMVDDVDGMMNCLEI